MTNIKLTLPDDLKAFIDSQTAQGGYASAEEYLRALILEAQKKKAKEKLEAKLLEGLQGPVVEMSREDWEIIHRKALERFEDETTFSQKKSSNTNTEPSGT